MRNLLQYRDVWLQERTHSIHSDRLVRLRRLLYVLVRVRSLGHVDGLAFTGKDVRPQTQVVVLVALEVQQNVAIRTLRGIDVRYVRKVRIVRVELFGEMNELTAVVRILKQYDVQCIQTDRSHVKVFC